MTHILISFKYAMTDILHPQTPHSEHHMCTTLIIYSWLIFSLRWLKM